MNANEVPLFRNSREKRLIGVCLAIMSLALPFIYAFGVFVRFDRLYRYTLEAPGNKYNFAFVDYIREQSEETKRKEPRPGFQCIHNDPYGGERAIYAEMDELDRIDSTAGFIGVEAHVDWASDEIAGWLCAERIPFYVRGCDLNESYNRPFWRFMRAEADEYCEKQKELEAAGEPLLPPLEGIYPKARVVMQAYADRIETATHRYGEIAWPFRFIMYTWLLLQIAAPIYVVYMLRRRRKTQLARLTNT